MFAPVSTRPSAVTCSRQKSLKNTFARSSATTPPRSDARPQAHSAISAKRGAPRRGGGLGARSCVGLTIASLLRDETLPATGDTRALVPPTGEAFVRRVPGRNLWLWYTVAADVVTVESPVESCVH